MSSRNPRSSRASSSKKPADNPDTPAVGDGVVDTPDSNSSDDDSEIVDLTDLVDDNPLPSSKGEAPKEKDMTKENTTIEPEVVEHTVDEPSFFDKAKDVAVDSYQAFTETPATRKMVIGGLFLLAGIIGRWSGKRAAAKAKAPAVVEASTSK